jgi:hypothetical protein
LQNLGGGTAGRAVFGATTAADAATAAGLGTGDAVTFSTLNVGQITSSAGIRDSSALNGSINAYVTSGLAGSHIASRRSVSVVLDWDDNSTSEKFAVFANGFYLSTGELFAVPETGPVTALNGLSTSGTLSVTGASTLGAVIATPQALSGNGAVAAVNLTTATTTIANDGTENTTTTLAAGTAGQIKTIAFVADGGFDAVVTVTNPAWGGSGTITMNDVGDSVMLQYLNSLWVVISNNGCTLA